MKSPARRFAAALSALAVLVVAAPSAVAAPASISGNASCAGAGSSALAPGQGFGFPGERAGVSHFLQSLGGPAGQIVSGIARQHGTADVCFPEGVPGE
jgi:hypothetical protein